MDLLSSVATEQVLKVMLHPKNLLNNHKMNLSFSVQESSSSTTQVITNGSITYGIKSKDWEGH